MGQQLTPDATAEVMSELDIDGDGTIEVSEFLDKLKEANNEREADRKRCQTLFAEADDDGSGFLDEAEMATVAAHMGLAEQVSNPEFVQQVRFAVTSCLLMVCSLSAWAHSAHTFHSRFVLTLFGQMMLEIESLNKDADVDDIDQQEGYGKSSDGLISFQEFVRWFHEIGVSYLERPQYASKLNLEAPSAEELKALFEDIDDDGSGEVDLDECGDKLQQIWPYMDTRGFERAFNAADDDGSGSIEMPEFLQLVQYIVWLNEKRHSVTELEDAFRSDDGAGTTILHSCSLQRHACFFLLCAMSMVCSSLLLSLLLTHVCSSNGAGANTVGEEEFYFGCHIIGFGGSDADSAWLFAEECKRLAASRWSGVGTKRTVELLNFEEFVQWAVKHAMAAPKIPSEAELRAKVGYKQSRFR